MKKTLKEFIKANDITSQNIPVFSRPDKTDGDEWDNKAHHFQVRITYNKNHYDVLYSMGSGHFLSNMGEGELYRLKEDRPMEYKRRKTEDRKKPFCSDVLYSLVMDCQNMGWYNLEGWCDDFGYDSVKAQKIYSSCQRQAKELKKLLGSELFNELMEIEDLEE